jgi:O-antigen biosynthesis protein
LTSHRNAGAPRLIDWTGERCVPWTRDVAVIYEHFHRYLWAAQLARGRRVLDLGSGEGFGAAILADAAADVVGVDIDQAAIEHSQSNYARPGLAFSQGSATDLSPFEAGTFDVVVAFEVIEHLAEQEQVLAEIGRVLRHDGSLVISTPDRRAYTESSGNLNPFHVRELALEEFVSLIGTQFEHVELFGQTLVEGSQINPLEVDTGAPIEAHTINFTLARTGEDWRLARAFSPMYLVAVASNVPVQPPPPSTLADPEHSLISDMEAEVRADREDLVGQIQRLKDGLTTMESELVVARQRIAEIDNSVAINIVEALTRRFNRVVPKESRVGRMVQATLRLIGRAVLRRQQ